jgi:hypothetical protein
MYVSSDSVLGIIQIQESSSDTLSEKSSVRSSSDSSLRMVLLHEISVSQLMAEYAATVAASGSDNIFSHKWIASRDSSSKVYSVLPHPSNPSLLVVASSIGIVILRIKMPQTHLVGSHEAWGGAVISFADKVIKRDTYRRCKDAPLNSISDSASMLSSPSPLTLRRSLSLLQTGSRKSVKAATGKSQQVSDDSISPNGFNKLMHPIMRVGETEEINVSADFSSISNSVTMLNQTKRPVKSDLLLLATMTCRPQIRSSPSGTVLVLLIAFLRSPTSLRRKILCTPLAGITLLCDI